MAYSVDAGHTLYPAIPLIIKWTHEYSGHIYKDGDYTDSRQHVLPLINTNLTTIVLDI